MTTITLRDGQSYDSNAIGALLNRIPVVKGVRQIPDYVLHFEGHGDFTPDGKLDTPPVLSNEELSAIEVWAFDEQPPQRFVGYVRLDSGRYFVTTWTGEGLGAADLSRPYNSYGYALSRRQAVTLHAINGCTYHGVYCIDPGNFVRLRMSRSDAARLRDTPMGKRIGPKRRQDEKR